MSTHRFRVYMESGPLEMTVEYLDAQDKPARAKVHCRLGRLVGAPGMGGNLEIYVNEKRVWNSAEHHSGK